LSGEKKTVMPESVTKKPLCFLSAFI